MQDSVPTLDVLFFKMGQLKREHESHKKVLRERTSYSNKPAERCKAMALNHRADLVQKVPMLTNGMLPKVLVTCSNIVRTQDIPWMEETLHHLAPLHFCHT